MILDEIVACKRRELKRAREERPAAELRTMARSAAPLRDFTAAIRREGEVAIVAEIKRASPARGVLRENLDPAELAGKYAEGGARAISVLTDREFFHGSAEDLRAARTAGLPVLRKDFVIDEYQLWEARVMLADAAILIARILDSNQLAEYVALAKEELKLAVLVEVHAEKELERALDAGAPIVGINNRDLATFRVSMETTARLRPLVPAGVPVVSESGIAAAKDMELLRHLKVDAALVGEELVTSPDPAAKLRELYGGARNPRGR
ncbi:MAG: indole-3-glycerol phosphate synthase TrpC [Planctomycetes bacterium]|nr:indole-3-glycerol phosphate synthase TrpC [Planctomycetota bacterium]